MVPKHFTDKMHSLGIPWDCPAVSVHIVVTLVLALH